MRSAGQVRPPARIEAIASLPLFHKLEGRKAVVVGSSAAADWKAELLEAAGARVVRLGGSWSADQLQGSAVVVGEGGDRAKELAKAARGAGAIANIIDRPELGDVEFGAIVNRAPILIAISTDGAAPMLGQSIRAWIEARLPRGLSTWARAAKERRPRVKSTFKDFWERRRFWEAFVAAAWDAPDRTPCESDLQALVERGTRPKGRVTLVGAGPGDPDLLTLKALQALGRATVILHDRLVSAGVLELARREALRIEVGKSAHGPSASQADINRLMIELAADGEQVVRLKGGDPSIFGRASEEIAACRAAGIEVSLVPGISAAQGAASSLLISLTERAHARRVQFLTGHGADGKLPGDIDWSSVADRKVTTVLYMPRGTLKDFVRTALRKGLDPATPAVAIASATLPEETHVAGRISEIGALAAGLPAGAPVAVLIGWVCRSHVEGMADPIPMRRVQAS